MKLKHYFLLLILPIAIISTAQQGSIKGRIEDSATKAALQNATVQLVSMRDSSQSLTVSSKEGGAFYFTRLPNGAYDLLVTYEGYDQSKQKVFINKKNKDIDLGSIKMTVKVGQLDEVVVKQSAIVMKKDTMEFNASSFHTKPNALAEDLLKKLPGMDVDKNGNIKAQGETVQRILVDGKRFFSDDPKLATKNLPPDIIDKVQVFDDLSDQSKFTGFDDGNRVKTINITTRKDKRTGVFGKAYAGAGTDETYDENFNLHKFKGNRQISIVGQGNDVNKQNFTAQDIGGGRGSGGGSSGGITTLWAGGVNAKDSWGKNGDIDVNGSYFYNHNHNVSISNSATQTILTADSSTYRNAQSQSVSNTQNHRIFFNVEKKITDTNSFVFRPNITIQQSTPNSSSSSYTLYDAKNDTSNSSINSSNSKNNGFNINNTNLQLRHRFRKAGRTISLDMNVNANWNEGDGKSINNNFILVPTSSLTYLNQYYNDTVHSYSFSPTLSYGEPVTAHSLIELNYNHGLNHNVSITNTYNYNPAKKGYTDFDSLFSNTIRYTTNSDKFGLSYRIQQTLYNINFGLGVQNTQYSIKNETKNIDISPSYVNLVPTFRFMYNFDKTTSLRFFYTGRPGQPSVSQLQPVQYVSGIDTSIGNPNLKQQYTHSIRFLYNAFNPLTQKVFMVSFNASMLVNDIQNQITNYANGSKTTTYTNENGTVNANAYLNYVIPFRKPKSNIHFTTNLSFSQSNTSIANQNKQAAIPLVYNLNLNRNSSMNETFKFTTNLKEYFDVNLSEGFTYNIVSNSLTPSQNVSYFSQTSSAEATFFTKNGWVLETTLDYTYNGNRAAGYNSSVPLLSPAIAKQFLKDKAAEVRISCFDILNQNVSVSRSISNNTIQDSRTNTLTRYFMLSFTYNLRKFAGMPNKANRPWREGGEGFHGGGGGWGGHRPGGGGF